MTETQDKRGARQRVFWIAGAAGLLFVLALAAAFVDARSWRSDLTMRAATVASEGRSLDAIAFTLAGAPARGDFIGMAGADFERTLLRTGAALRLVKEVGRVRHFQFANDGRCLVTIAFEDNAAFLHDLSSGAVAALGKVPPGDHSVAFSSNGRFLVTEPGEWPNADEGWTLRNLSTGAATRLGWISNYVFSGDSRFLLTQTARGAGALYDLERGTQTPLGDLTDQAFDFSGDGRYLLITGEGATLRDLARGTPASIGRVREFRFSQDGRFLLIEAGAGQWTLTELASGAQAPLGYATDFAFSRDGRWLFILSGVGALRDLRTGAETELGEAGGLGSFAFSNDSRFLLTLDGNKQALLRDLAGGGARSLGQVDNWGFDFSGDSRFLTTMAADNRVTLHDLRSRASTPLGALSGDAFLADRFLFLWNQDSSGTLRELASGVSMPLGFVDSFTFPMRGQLLAIRTRDQAGAVWDLSSIPRSRGARLRSDVCSANGDLIRPFARDVRAGARPEDRNIRNRLRGRPWNPCDWRGLLAILPDARHGDGWFEGARQWARLIGVRYLSRRDWACRETTSAASAEQRRLRQRLCAGLAR